MKFKTQILKKRGLSDNALVTLVMIENGSIKNTDLMYRKELEIFEFIEKDEITKLGDSFLNHNNTIKRLKTMIE